MMKNVRDFFTLNLVWKLVSLLVAILLWFIGMNINNPTQTGNFTLALEIRNKSVVEDNHYILLNEAALTSETIEVRVRAPKNDINELNRNKKNFKAYIDFNPIDISRTDVVGEFRPVTVQTELPTYLSARNFEIISNNPPTVNILLDRYITKSFVVAVDREGDVKEGYISLAPVVVPNKIKVSGAETVVNTIDSLRATVSLTDAFEDILVNEKVTAVDANGTAITNVDLDVKEAEIAVQVDKYGKIPIANPTLIGNVAEGYSVESVTVTPRYVEIVGAEEDINLIKSIELETINVDNISATRTLPFDLRKYLMDTNLSIKNGSPHEAVVTVNVVKEDIKKIEIPIENLTIKGIMTSIELPGGSVPLMVKGSEKNVSGLDAANVSGVLDITGLEPGVYEVEASFSLPAGVVQIGKTVVGGVVIYDESATAAPDTQEVPDEDTKEQPDGEQTPVITTDTPVTEPPKPSGS